VQAARRFHLPAPASPASPLQVVCAGWEHCAPEYEVNRREFPFQSVELVISGRGWVELEGRRHDLGPGAVFTYGPSVAHRIRSDETVPLSKYFVDYTGSGSTALLGEFGLPDDQPFRLQHFAQPRHVFDHLIHVGRQAGTHSRRMTALALELLLHAFAHARSEVDGATLRRRETFQRCRDYVDGHFLSLRSVEGIAESCFVHRSHLCRLFREFQGTSPLHYLQQRRMEWAAERLVATGALVREVADALSMDPFQLSRTFKRVLGLAPTDLVRDRSPAHTSS
jgi:AraC-like DNA-binding protein